jgi:hypothetical protein
VVLLEVRDLQSRDRFNSRTVENYRYYSKSAILCIGIARLDGVISSQSVFDIQVDIEDVVAFVLLDNISQFFVLSAYLLDVLSVDALFREVNEDTPSPNLFLLACGSLLSRGNRHSNHSSWDKIRNDVFRFHYNFANLSLYLDFLLFEFLLLSDELFIRNLQASKLGQVSFKALFKSRETSFTLELVETLQDDVFWVNVFQSHHIK